MLDKIILYFLQNRLWVIIITLFIIAAGIYSALTLPIDAFPDVTNVQVEIISSAPGRSPLEVEKFVTYPIEISMRGLPGLIQSRSVSKYGSSVVTLIFNDKVDIYFARQLVFERLVEAKEKLPQGIEATLGPIATAMGEIYQYTLESEESRDKANTPEYLVKLRTMQDWIVSPLLKNIPGVNEVNSFGGYIKQYQVVVNPDLLRKYDIRLNDVFEAVKNNNSNVGGAFLEQASEQYLIRGVGMLGSLNDIENIALKTVDGTPVLIDNVAIVREGQAIRQGAALKDGKKEVVGGIVMMLRGCNSREVVRLVEKKVDEINNSNILPKGIKIIPFYDRSDIVQKATHTLVKSLTEGIFFVIIILYFLLRNVRGSIVVIISLLLSSFLTFIIMKQAGISANLMSLGGLAISIGMIIDAAIIQTENVERHLHENKDFQDKIAIVFQSVIEVRKPSILGELIIALTFLPIQALQGMEGKMFTPLAKTIFIALLASLIISIVITPTLCCIFLKTFKENNKFNIVSIIRRKYLPLLDWSLQHRRIVFTGIVFLLLSSFVLFPFLGREFVPVMDEGAFDMDTILLPGVSLTESLKINKKAQEILMEFPELETVVSKTGSTEIAIEAKGAESTFSTGIFAPKRKWKTAKSKEELIDKMRQRLSKIPGIVFSFSQPIQCRIDELIAGTKSQVVIKLFGEDMELLKEKASEIARVISTVKGNTDLAVEQTAGQPYITISIDRQKIAQYGINVADVQNIIETAIGGKAATKIYEGNKSFDVFVRFSEKKRGTADILGNITVDVPGQDIKIPLSQLTNITVEEGPLQIGREYGQRRILIQCNVKGRDIGSFVDECKKRLKGKVTLPVGYYLSWGGQFENQQRVMKKLVIIIPVTIAIIFLLLFLTFSSSRQALLIMLNLPFALIGGIFALFISRLYLSVPASVGFITLFGVAILNGVVLVSYMNQLRENGMSLCESVSQGCSTRLRPILMTASITVFSLLPLLFATGPGSEIQRPVAVVVIGGLITSTVLTLIVLPILYSKIEEL